MIATALVCGAAAVTADHDPVNLIIENRRAQPLTMSFAFAVKNYQWTLASRSLAAGEELNYPLPVALPACSITRDLHLADGVVSISDSKGWYCELRFSMCDAGDHMMVRDDRCYWTTSRALPD